MPAQTAPYGATLEQCRGHRRRRNTGSDERRPPTLTLDDGTTVTGGGSGTLTINFASTLDVEAGPAGNGLAHGATIDGVLVTDNGAIDIGDVTSGAILTLDDATTITGGGSGTLTIDAADTLDIEAGPHGPSTAPRWTAFWWAKRLAARWSA